MDNRLTCIYTTRGFVAGGDYPAALMEAGNRAENTPWQPPTISGIRAAFGELRRLWANYSPQMPRGCRVAKRTAGSKGRPMSSPALVRLEEDGASRWMRARHAANLALVADEGVFLRLRRGEVPAELIQTVDELKVLGEAWLARNAAVMSVAMKKSPLGGCRMNPDYRARVLVGGSCWFQGLQPDHG